MSSLIVTVHHMPVNIPSRYARITAENPISDSRILVKRSLAAERIQCGPFTAILSSETTSDLMLLLRQISCRSLSAF